MHGRLAVIAGGTVVDELVGLPYDLGRERATSAMERTKPEIVVFTTPNNPTGNEIAPEVILSVARAFPRTLVLVDEAYSDFAGTTLLPNLEANPNMVISKTFSKVRAAAGLRLGVLITHSEIADMFRAVQLPYNVSALTHTVAAKIAKDDGSIARRVALCATERARVTAALAKAPSVEVYPSVTNFVLFRVKDGDTAGAHARFLAQSVLIRDISSWPGCAGCLRVSIGTAAENDRFIAAIPKALAA
jgi:histidinol-phosphate aminotransferase